MAWIEEGFQETENIAGVDLLPLGEMQTDVFVHDGVELAWCTLSLGEDLHQKDDLTHSQGAHTALNDLSLEDLLEGLKLNHDARGDIPSNNRNELAFLQAWDIFLDKRLPLNAYHLKRDFLTTFADLVMFGNHVHNGSEIGGWHANQAISEYFVKDFEKLILRPEMLQGER